MQPNRLSSKRLMSEILLGSSIPQQGQQQDEKMQQDPPLTSNHHGGDSVNENDNHKIGRNDLVILDCQSPSDFHRAHIRGAINVTFPAIMIRRIAAGKIDLFEKSKELKAKMANARFTFIVYDSMKGGPIQMISSSSPVAMEQDNGSNSCDGGYVGGSGSDEVSDLVSMVAKKLAQKGCRVATLAGGLDEFRALYPEWVETNETRSRVASTSSCGSSGTGSPRPPGVGGLNHENEIPLLGLGSLASLRIQDEADNCDSCISVEADDNFPVEIIPYLYLGNASIAGDAAALEKYNIKHIINVTPDLPNHFEDEIRYMKIPISDHWTSTMLTYFPSAINFIDEGRMKEEGVLVHCLAGISRSVTITMAYIMFKMALSLNEAYDLVRARKSNISPNFHFMGQLLDFELILSSSTPDGRSQFLSPATLGASPDSGIEFDRWNTT